MDESALRSQISTLNDNISALGPRLHFWTWLVVIGVALEVAFIIHAYAKERSDWDSARTRGFITPPDKPSISWLILEVLSVVLVVAGIAGELHIDIVAGRRETQLRDANGKLQLLLEGKANNAETSARNAAIEAGLAQTSAGEANTAAKDAQGKAKSAGAQAQLASAAAGAANTHADQLALQTEQLRKGNDEAEGKIETERRKRVALATSMLPRNLFDQSGIIAKLSKFRPVTVRIEYVDEEEPQKTAEQIAFVLQMLKWPFTKLPAIDRAPSLIREGILIDGGVKRSPDASMVVYVSQRRQAGIVSEAICEALMDSGIICIHSPIAAAQFVPSDELIISVGRKPNPVLEEQIRELGSFPQATPNSQGNRMGGNRVSIPDPKP